MMESLVQGKLARRVRWGGCRNVRSERNEARCVLTQSLRQRLARFVRKTLSFSKSAVLHEACLLLFLHRYNRDRAIILM